MHVFHTYPPKNSLSLDSRLAMSAPLCRIFDCVKLEILLEDLKERPLAYSSIKLERTQKIAEMANAILADVYELLLDAAEMSVHAFCQMEIGYRIQLAGAIDASALAVLDEVLPLIVQKIKTLPSISEKFLFLDFFAGEQFSYNKLFKALALPHALALSGGAIQHCCR